MEPKIKHVFLPFILYCLAAFITYPTAAQVIIQRVCEEVENGINCNSAAVSSRASILHLYTSLICNIPCVILAGFYGSMADHCGRKLVMYLPLLGSLFYSLIYCYIAIAKPKFFLYFALLASFLLGISGAFGAFLMAIFSYVSDVTSNSPGTRSQTYSSVESCLFVAKIIGPLGAGIWASRYGFITPLILSVIITMTSIAAVLCIPESLPESAEIRKTPLRIDLFKTFQNIRLLFSFVPLYGQSPLPWVIGAFFIYFIGVMGDSAIFFVFVKHVFNWGPDLIGYYVATEGCLQMFSMLILPDILEYLMGHPLDDIIWIQTGYLSR